MDYEKTKQIWEEYSDAEKGEIILQIVDVVEQHMTDLSGFKGARFPDVMNDVGKAGICSDMFYYAMELLTGERYAVGELFIYDKYDWEIHVGETWEDTYLEE